MNTDGFLKNPLFRMVPGNQQGVATLSITLIILIIVTLMVIFAARVGIFDQRMSANDYRYKETFAVSDGGLEYAIQQFAENVSNSNGNYIYDPDKNGTEDAIPDPFLSNKNLTGGSAGSTEAQFTASVVKNVVSGINVYTFTSNGQSADDTGQAAVSSQIVFRHITGGNTPDTPIIADGSMNVTGNMHVVPNPNASCPSGAAGNGCAVSVWTNGPVSTSSSISTCQYQGFTGGQCPNPSLDPLHTQITNATYQGVDIVANDPYAPTGHFPPDLFNYVFGVPYTDWPAIKSVAESLTPSQVYPDCGSLDSSSKGINWITGDCTINAGATIGSLANPVILVVHNHQFKTGGNAVIYGIVFIFDDTPATDGDVPGPDVGGGTEIRGSLIANTDFGSGGTGTFAVVWDPKVFENIQNNSDASYLQLATIPGSWQDF